MAVMQTVRTRLTRARRLGAALFSLIIALLSVGWIVGCAPAASQAGGHTISSADGRDVEPTLSESRNNITPTLLVTLAPTNTPTTVPTLATTSTATTVPAISPTAPPTTLATPADTPVTEPTATAASSSPPDSAASGELIAYGLQVYMEQYCGVCHQLDAANTAGKFGPSQNGLGTTAERRTKDPQYTGQATTAAEYIRESIVDPGAYYVTGYEQSRQHMPAFSHLSETELDALVQMLLQQK